MMKYFLILFSSLYVMAQERISSFIFDTSKPFVIHIKPGLTSIVQFPCEISEVQMGLKRSLKVEVSKVNKRDLILSAQSTLSPPTNVIVRCGERLFVFDILLNKQFHEDIIKIRGAISRLNQVKEEKISLHQVLKRKAKEISPPLKPKSGNF